MIKFTITCDHCEEKIEGQPIILTDGDDDNHFCHYICVEGWVLKENERVLKLLNDLDQEENKNDDIPPIPGDNK